ncbi:hypothetical protein [Paenibacillus xylanivorans]|uniref:Uncharacterized protein n=1 Tax=Paenibacillus xylanivorans TaxID=1705561 RepID=A0A0N0UHU8_9BACL|nr:hypothetical protein [Paenibacillus xylanivorans]KOY15954.1 hypothetical protein AMS66_15175 [Paenibacillus xylanivorans]
MKIKYEMPESLVDIVRIDKELRERNAGTFQDFVGFYISFNNDEDRYYCTPDDAIIFGRTGANGDHFAFYAFNGSFTDLEEAPIIFIQPMAAGNQVTLVARNLKDLLALFINLKEIYVLERFRFYKNKLDFINDYNDNYLNDIRLRENDSNFIINLLRTKIEGIVNIDDVYEYIIDLNKQIKLVVDNDGY